jgi:transposase
MAKSQENGTTILLGLKGHRVGEVKEKDEGIVVEVEGGIRGDSCAYCGSTKLYRHGVCKPRKVLHSWSQGKKIYLRLYRQRWRCRECKRSFSDSVELLRSYSRITKQAEEEILWQMKDHSFSQIARNLGVGYSTQRRLLEREIDEEALGFIQREDEIYLGIDEHSFRHQELVHTVTEIKKKHVVGILRDDRIATLKQFLSKIPGDKVKEVCIDMKESLRKVAEALYPEAKVVVDHFHVVADANRRMDEARRIEQDVHQKRKVKIPKKIFLIGNEKLGEKEKQRLDELLNKYPTLKAFYWGKEKIRELYWQESQAEAVKFLDNIILNLKSDDDGELIRWGNTLKHWHEPILNYFDNRTTNGFTEGCNTKIKMLKRISYGLKNIEVYWRKMLLGFVPSRSSFHTI